MLDPKTKMPFGTYKNWPISQIPAKMIAKLKTDFLKSPRGYDHHGTFLCELFEIDPKVIEKPLETKPADAIAPAPAPAEKLCTKAEFPNKGEAKFRIRAINAENALLETDEKIKQPIRAYECEICGAWHLTSKEKPFKTKKR